MTKELEELGIEVLGDEKNFHVWMESENVKLGNRSPSDFVSNFGSSKVIELLNMIKYGMY